MQRHYLALDLKNDPALIAEYIEHHRNVWPEVLASIRDSGVTNMQIYRRDDRLFMMMEVDDSFSFERKVALDQEDAHVQAWEALMGKFQQRLPSTRPGEKWVLMDCIFDLHGAPEAQSIA